MIFNFSMIQKMAALLAEGASRDAMDAESAWTANTVGLVEAAKVLLAA